MDSWYATKEIMLSIEDLKKIYYCPLKDNRQVDDSGGVEPYHRVDGLQWSDAEREYGIENCMRKKVPFIMIPACCAKPTTCYNDLLS